MPYGLTCQRLRYMVRIVELRVSSPCSANWDRMQGDERVRYCPECKLNVYNFNAMDATEIEQLVRNREGRLCARFYARSDGRLLTHDCPVGFRARLRRGSRAATTLLSMALSATLTAAQTIRSKPPHNPSTKQQSRSTLLLKVEDQTSARIPGADLSLVSEATSEQRKATTDPAGQFVFGDLTPGKYSIIAIAPGFTTLKRYFEIRSNQTQQMTLSLKLGVVLMGEVIEVLAVPLSEPIRLPE